MLESAASPLAHEFKAPKAAPSSTSPERPSGKNFTPLSSAPKGEQIDRLVQDAVNDSEKEIAAAKKRTDKSTGTESPPPPPPASRPMPQEIPQQLPPGVTPEAFAQIQGDMARGTITQEQALAKLEGMVSKATGAPLEEHKPPPVKAPVKTENVVATPLKASSAPPTSGESKFPALQKIKNMFGKMWDSISSFLKGITSWITK